MDGISALTIAVKRDLLILTHPTKPWVPTRVTLDTKQVKNNVIIVGAGQSGLGIALQLKLNLVDKVLLLDQNPRFSEGPWNTYARMERLLTPKWITGLDAGVNLCF
eukprot:TRINITY_DN11504_c0_g2_i4.p1 TRINITY_DN11504_c0_g2~~TRINITY_DN11504_c0_g2_i4.p1  ORF type:complete len:106 (+),score=12.37 TRINITY_DN11504_c0_g2_i4:46-363(+)